VDAFLVKKLVSNLVHIVPGAFVGLLICILCLRHFPRLARSGLWFIVLSLITLSSAPVSNTFVGTLESRYADLSRLPEDTRLVLVLGSSHYWMAERSVNNVLSSAALSRVTEAARLWQTKPEVDLMVSGARFRSQVPHAVVMGDMAEMLGVSRSRLIFADNTRDTAEEIQRAVHWMQDNAEAEERLVVVSSSMHLPRAAAMLDDYSVLYTMAPADIRTQDSPWYMFSAENLRQVDFAVHEYIGLLWHRL
jgi:uncharacterized SAM-binding protein YcdF (DUF218 family)